MDENGSGEGSTMRNFIVCTVGGVIKSRRLRWAGHVAKIEKGRSAFQILTGNPTGKRPLGELWGRWEDSIKEVDINTRNWVDSAQDRDYWRVLVNSVFNFLVT